MLKFFAKQIFDALVVLFGNGLLNDIADFLSTINSATTDALNNGIISDAIGIFKGLAASLVILFFLVELLNEAQKDFVTFERLTVMLMRLLAVTIIVMNLELVVNGLEELSVTIFDAVKDLAGSTSNSFEIFGENASTGYRYSEVEDDLKDALGDAGIKQALMVILQLLIPWLISRLCYVVAYVIAVGRSIELIVRAIFSPIGVANLFEDGTRSSGIRYLKKFAACALQLGAIAVILYASSALCNTLIDTLSDGYMTITKDNILDVLASSALWSMSAIQLSVIGITLKAQGICNDILGV
ncbi:MAG: type IV secretion system protein [Eubacterium sp.]|nr:type IV secretion system protein [Eubacterium sp.]